MRHRIKAGKVGSFAPENRKVEVDELESREVTEEVEVIPYPHLHHELTTQVVMTTCVVSTLHPRMTLRTTR